MFQQNNYAGGVGVQVGAFRPTTDVEHLRAARAAARTSKEPPAAQFGCCVVLRNGRSAAATGSWHAKRSVKWLNMRYPLQCAVDLLVAQHELTEGPEGLEGATAYCYPRVPNLEDVNRLAACKFKRCVFTSTPSGLGGAQAEAWRRVEDECILRLVRAGIEVLQVSLTDLGEEEAPAASQSLFVGAQQFNVGNTGGSYFGSVGGVKVSER